MLSLLASFTLAFGLFSGRRQSEQRGHRITSKYCEDLPLCWAKQSKIAQENGDIPVEHEDDFLVATFACGCYWGPELAFQRTLGVHATCVGHTGYESGGANEAVQLIYNPLETSYEDLCDVLWDYIDPTLKNQVGVRSTWGSHLN